MAKIIDGLVLNGQSYEFTATDINLADIETDKGAASKAYAVGDHLILDGQYYIVTAPIAENDGLVVDTNIRVEKVGNEITGLSTDYKGKGHFHQDLNDIKVSCNFLAYGNCLNRPTTDNQWYTVSVIAGGTGSVIQEAVNARTHRKYYRHNNGESWSSWEIVPTGDFMFRNNNGQAQYSMDNGTTWKDFKHPVGAKSITANGEYDITDYASANVDVSASYFQSWGRDSAMTNETISSATMKAGTYIVFAWNAFAGVDYAYTNREIGFSLASSSGNSLNQAQMSHTVEKGVTTRVAIIKITNPTTLRINYYNQSNAYKEAMIGFYIAKVN